MSVIAEFSLRRGLAERDLAPYLWTVFDPLTLRHNIGDAGVQSAWQKNTALGEQETACESEDRSCYLSRFLPCQVHAGVTDVVAKRDPLALDVPLLRVDTTQGYALNREPIIAFCQSLWQNRA